MTWSFRNLSIRAKLIVLMMGISGAILALAVVSLLVIEVHSERDKVEAEIVSLASIIGFNSRAALIFGDQEVAVQTLAALKLKPEVVGAWMLNSQGEVFARYVRKDKRTSPLLSSNPPAPAQLSEPFGASGDGELKYRLDDGSLLFSHPLTLDGEQVGVLILQADMRKLDIHVSAFISAGMIILMFSGLAAFILATWLQRLISRPILDLAGIMGRVTKEKDYGLRLESRSGDEVGLLVDGFNAMLAEVEQRERLLEEANLLLEQRVRDRTVALEQANRQLLEKFKERQKAGQALRENEAHFRTLFENSPVSLWEGDFSAVKSYFDDLRASGVEDLEAHFDAYPEALYECARQVRILDVNQATVLLFKATSKQELLGSLFKIFTEESFDPFQKLLVALAHGKAIIETEGINKTLDGELKFLNVRLSVVPGHEETLSRLIVSLVDLSERREAEEALHILSKALETTRVGISITDMQGKIVFTNPAEASMHGYDISELLGQMANILGPPEFRAEFPGEKMKTGQRESLNLRKDGSVFPVQLVSDLVFDAAGNPLATVTVCEDITVRKETEERLKASIAEKDVLLKEVHHRVKNNLQIISSLLNLQMQKITETKTRAELNATRNRIQSMALIHAKLYQSENLSQINLAEYIEDFSRQLRSLYNVSPMRVQLVLDIAAVYLDVDVAIPCGMIVNELLTNALKYAFPGERCGEIRVVLRAEATETVLSVEDNGVGLPPRMDLERVETLGLQLVHGLAQQIRGSVTIDRSDGTRVEIRCPVAGSASK